MFFLGDPLRAGADPYAPTARVPDAVEVVTPEGAVLRYDRQRTARTVEGSTVWVGVGPGPHDALVVGRYDGSVAGEFSFGARAFVFGGSPHGDELLEVDHGRAECGQRPEDVEHTPAEGGAGMAMAMAGPSGGDDCTDDEADVLVAFTDAYRISKGGASGNPADDGGARAAIAAAVEGVNQRYLNSLMTTTRIRLVGTMWVDVDESGHSTCDLRGFLANPSTAPADVVTAPVHARRDAIGADFAALLTVPVGGGAGCAATPSDLPGMTPSQAQAQTQSPFVHVGANAMPQLLAHELGHGMGANHAVLFGANYAVPPEDTRDALSSGYCSTLNGRRTLMAKSLATGPCRDDVTPLQGLYFSNPNLVVYSDAMGHGLIPEDTYYPGLDLNPVDPAQPAKLHGANNAAQIDINFATFRHYRPRATPDSLAPQVVNPVDLSAVSGPNLSLSWTDVGANEYHVQIGTANGGSTLYDGSTGLNTTLFLLGGIPTTGQPLFVRVWARFASTWVYRDLRYNVLDRMIACSLEHDVTHPAAWSAAPCVVSSSICTEQAGVITCDLTRSGGAISAPKGWAVSHYDASLPTSCEPAHPYRFTMFGNAQNGAAFCCLYADPVDDVDELALLGTDGADSLGFSYLLVNNLGDTSPLLGRISARMGNDSLFGSAVDNAWYTERLDGQRGNDTLWGFAGDDVLLGGRGSDTMYGGLGNDVLISGIAGDGADKLYGEAGADILCSEDASDLLVGGASNDPHTNFLYLSSNASGSPHPSSSAGNYGVCGHTSWGPFASNCSGFAFLSSAPAVCAAEGVDD